MKNCNAWTFCCTRNNKLWAGLSLGFLLAASFSLQASSTAEALRAQAILEFQQNHYRTAIGTVTQALELDANDALSHYYRGMFYLQLEEYDKATEDLTTARNLNSRIEQLAFNLGYAAYQSEQYGQAISNLSYAVQEQPSRAEAHFYLGLAHQKQRDYSAAQQPLQQAATLDDQYAAAVAYFVGVGQYRQGHIAQAISTLRLGVLHNPTSGYRVQSERLIARLETEKEERRKYSVSVALGVANDSNVGLFPGEDTEIYTVDQRSDTRSFINLSGDVSLSEQEHSQWRLGGAYNMSRHQDLSPYDIDALTVYIDQTQQMQSWLWNFRAGYRQLSLEGEAYTKGFYLVPSAIIQHRDNKASLLRLIWSDTDYDQEVHEGLSNYSGELHYRFVVDIDEVKQQQFYAGARYRLVNASDELYDYSSVGVELGYQSDVGKGLFSSHLRYDDREYNDSPRTQQLLEAGLAYDYPVSERFYLNGELVYIDSGSNLEFYQYDRSVVSVSVRWQQ